MGVLWHGVQITLIVVSSRLYSLSASQNVPVAKIIPKFPKSFDNGNKAKVQTALSNNRRLKNHHYTRGDGS